MSIRRINIAVSKYTKEEIEVIERYHLYFRYPLAAKSFSAGLSSIYISGIVIVVWLLLNKFWVLSGLVGLNALISALMQHKLNPLFFLHDAVERKDRKDLKDEMVILDSVVKKFFLD